MWVKGGHTTRIFPRGSFPWISGAPLIVQQLCTTNRKQQRRHKKKIKEGGSLEVRHIGSSSHLTLPCRRLTFNLFWWGPNRARRPILVPACQPDNTLWQFFAFAACHRRRFDCFPGGGEKWGTGWAATAHANCHVWNNFCVVVCFGLWALQRTKWCRGPEHKCPAANFLVTTESIFGPVSALYPLWVFIYSLRGVSKMPRKINIILQNASKISNLI